MRHVKCKGSKCSSVRDTKCKIATGARRETMFSGYMAQGARAVWANKNAFHQNVRSGRGEGCNV